MSCCNNSSPAKDLALNHFCANKGSVCSLQTQNLTVSVLNGVNLQDSALCNCDSGVYTPVVTSVTVPQAFTPSAPITATFVRVGQICTVNCSIQGTVDFNVSSQVALRVSLPLPASATDLSRGVAVLQALALPRHEVGVVYSFATTDAEIYISTLTPPTTYDAIINAQFSYVVA